MEGEEGVGGEVEGLAGVKEVVGGRRVFGGETDVGGG